MKIKTYLVKSLATCFALALTATLLTLPLLGQTQLDISNLTPGRPDMVCPEITVDEILVGGMLTPLTTGKWYAPAHPNWTGLNSFVVSGPLPQSGNSGTTTYEFLGGDTFPVGTFFNFSDVDGRGDERFLLTAFDMFGAQITGNWLDVPVPFAVWGTINGPNDMPFYTNTGGVYLIDGNHFPTPNPNVAFTLKNLSPDIHRLEVVKFDNNYGMSICAPVPEPTSGVLGLLSLLGFAVARRRA